MELHDLRTEAAQAALNGLQIVKEHFHAVEQRHFCLFGADQESCLQQQHIQRHRFHGHRLAAHVGAGNHRGAMVQRDGHRHESPALLLQQIHQLGIDHIHQFQLRFRDLRQHAAEANGKQRFLNDKVQASGAVGIRQQIVHHRRQGRTHGLADLHLLALLFRADTGALLAQIILFRVRLRVEKLFFHLLLRLADLFQPRRGAVGDVETAGTGFFRIKNRQRLCRIMKGKVTELRCGLRLMKQRNQTLQTLQITFNFKQLHMVGTFSGLTAAQ